MPLRPDQPSPFKDNISTAYKDALLPLYDAVASDTTSTKTDEGGKSPPNPSAGNDEKVPEPIYDHPEPWENRPKSPRTVVKNNEYV